MFALVVRFELRPEQANSFDRLMHETVSAIRSDEPGTLVYVCCTVDEAPNSRIFMEVYADRQAFKAHERTPATMRFLNQRPSMVESTRVEFLTPYEWKM